MKAKWCFSILLVVLTCIGVFRDDAVVPNQELILEFDSTEVSASQTEYTITAVKQQLKEAGVHVVQVHNESDGKYSITYYSASDVSQIKAILASSPSLAGVGSKTSPSQLPLEKKLSHYHVDIYEITSSVDSEIDLNGTLVLTEKRDLDRFKSPTFNPFLKQEYSKLKSKDEAVAYKINSTVVHTLRKGLYTIPEVRAGPSNFITA
ncbi:hypothetical protein [Bizionia paragorgiae]|uniref:hypothetical protein n=1 Tax=Bizionia paragorgiae TaxID=283786 RepID=UPI00299DAEA0|nr:hypothetical protein [Bizionia paragorgiae]MDX1271032.1 hypothetical protein [Bizionia paragorgiae]